MTTAVRSERKIRIDVTKLFGAVSLEAKAGTKLGTKVGTKPRTTTEPSRI